MARAFRERDYHVFLSHSSADKEDFVDPLYDWLANKADMKVWYDRQLTGQSDSMISDAMANCRSALFVISKNVPAKGWVEKEYGLALREETTTKGQFRIVSLRLDESPGPSLLSTLSHINALGRQLPAENAARLLSELAGGDDADGGAALYFSRGTHEKDAAFNDPIAAALRATDFRLVCDAPDWKSASDESGQARLQRLISGCGALVAVLPHRRDDGSTSDAVLGEIAIAMSLDVPVMVFAAEGVKVGPEWGFEVHPLELAKLQSEEAVDEHYGPQLYKLRNAWREPAYGRHVFLGHSFDASAKTLFGPMQQLISRVTGLPVRVGPWQARKGAQRRIIELIQTSEFCIIDLTNTSFADHSLPEKIDYGFNSAIEAGMALGAGRQLFLTCKGKERKPPFMFGDHDVKWYQSELELVGILRAICAPYRRRVIR